MEVPPTSSAGSSSTSSVADIDKDQINPPKGAVVSNQHMIDGTNSEDTTTKTITNEKTSADPSQGISRVGSTTTSIRRTETREDGSEYPTGLKLFLIIVALCLAVFLMCLDNTIIATAIPKITDQFNSLDDIGWYASCTYSRFSTASPLVFFFFLCTYMMPPPTELY